MSSTESLVAKLREAADHLLALVSIIAGHEMVLCLRCYLEKLKEIGVREVEQIP